MEQHHAEGAGETGYPRENSPTSGIVRHDSHVRESGSDTETTGHVIPYTATLNLTEKCVYSGSRSYEVSHFSVKEFTNKHAPVVLRGFVSTRRHGTIKLLYLLMTRASHGITHLDKTRDGCDSTSHAHFARYGSCTSGGHVVDVLTYHFLKPNSAHRPKTASITLVFLQHGKHKQRGWWALRGLCNWTSKVKKRGSDTGDSYTHAQCLITPMRKDVGPSTSTFTRARLRQLPSPLFLCIAQHRGHNGRVVRQLASRQMAPPRSPRLSGTMLSTVIKSKGPDWLAQWSSAGMQGRGKREISEKNRRPKASSCMIPTSKNPGLTRSGIEALVWGGGASGLTAQSPRPPYGKNAPCD
ncbi:hypothetical protein PR048_025893 [Dryococelus australis]|uniref:Uncharacterized protein n=1 Tax=Dryococelus australis TaxID=614101 RepID=A0ABQ9GJV1_9NEOP|nr:hypothetical protein PR048_025893 [Dryococelus australis]